MHHCHDLRLIYSFYVEPITRYYPIIQRNYAQLLESDNFAAAIWFAQQIANM